MAIKLTRKTEQFEDDSKIHRVSELILNPKISFQKHIQKLIEIDKINDKNGKKLHKSPEDLLAWINSKHELENIHGQLGSYLQIAQTELPEKTFYKYYKQWVQANEEIAKVSVDEAKLILKNKATIQKFLNTPLLQDYKRWFNARYFSEEDHQIDAYEAIAIKETRGTELIQRLFDAVFRGDFRVDPPIDSNGKKITNVSLGECIASDDPSVRQTTWCNYIDAIWSRINTLTEMIRIKMFRTWQNANYREFKTVFEQIMHDYELSAELGDKIFKVCKSCQKEFAWFVNRNDKAIAIQNNAKEITPWDRDKGVGINHVTGISKEEAKKDILHCLSILGPEYTALVVKVFEEKWIDWNWNPKSGETNFSCTMSGNCKYPIKVNFNGDAQDVIVLAHEMGHSINAELCKKNGVYQGFNQLLSEIPSFVNETLMFLYYINVKYKDNARQEHHILTQSMMERLYSCICDHSIYQLTVNELEKEFLKTGNLFAKRIIDTYRKIKKQYGVLLPIEEKWMKAEDIRSIYDISSFEAIFNVIGSVHNIVYLLGATVGVCIAIKIFNGDKKTTAKYIQFLKTGQAKNPLALLKSVGFDITKPQTFAPLAKICQILNGTLARYVPANAPEIAEAEEKERKPLMLKRKGEASSQGKRKLVL